MSKSDRYHTEPRIKRRTQVEKIREQLADAAAGLDALQERYAETSDVEERYELAGLITFAGELHGRLVVALHRAEDQEGR